MTKVCCVCQRVELGTSWKDDYVFAPDERVTHGYCPLCFDVVMSDLMDYIRDKGAQVNSAAMTSCHSRQPSVCV